jgi:hypothetical protein
MWFPAQRRDYWSWIEQKVWGVGVERLTRRECIQAFTESLVSAIEATGYKMCSEFHTTATVGRWLYWIHVERAGQLGARTRILPGPYHRNLPEDREHFDYTLDYEWVEKFKQRWSSTEDFDPESDIGNTVWSELQEFIYHFIDPELSFQGQVVDHLLNPTDSENESGDEGMGRKSRGKEDIYTQESRQGFHSVVR